MVRIFDRLIRLERLVDIRSSLVKRATQYDANGGRRLSKAARWFQMAETWLTAHEGAERARCGTKTIYREVKAGRLRAARVGGRRELRFLDLWIDEWLVRCSTVLELQ